MFELGKKPNKRSILRKLAMVMIALSIALIGAAIYGYTWYTNQLKPAAADSYVVEVVVEPGSSTGQIAKLLEDKKIIKSALAFEIHARISEKRSKLKAGIYELDPSLSTPEIATLLSSGVIATDSFTITPGLRLDQVERLFIQAGFSEEEVTKALIASNYKDHPALIDLPIGASLEGYLYPETFQITADDKPEDIIRRSLDELAKIFSQERVAAWKKQGLDTYEAITLASIVEMEVPDAQDRKVVAQVFLKRLAEGATLGSDVTYYYAAALSGEDPTPDLESPYNTRIYAGLPPGPIANPDLSSLIAVAEPADTDYYYFVAGEDGKTYFANTEEQHQYNIATFCKSLCDL